MLTKQQIFNKVAAHLMKQQKKSRNTNGSCKYRGPKGLKCAVGCLIPDSKYQDAFDNMKDTTIKCVLETVGEIELFGQKLEPGINTINLLSDLQSIHDHELILNWRFSLQSLAEAYHLKIPKALK